VSRVPVEQTAFAHRQAGFSVVIVSMWSDPATSAANTAWTRDLYTALQPFSIEAVYVNYLDTDDANRVGAAYNPETYQRLRRLKAKYDPENVFQINQNVAPAR